MRSAEHDYVIDYLERWGAWNRSGIFSGKYRCTLSAPFSGTPPQEQAGFTPLDVQRVENEILKLNQTHRRLVRLIKKRFIRSLPYEAIAADLGISTTTVYRGLCRAYDLLAPRLQYEKEMLIS